jgi:predicted nucleic acid-binding protein
MVVPDTSAMIALLRSGPGQSPIDERLRQDAELHAPHLLDVEFVHALRGLIQGGKLGVGRAEGTLEDFMSLPIIRYPHELLVPRMWELRENLTGYDAAFVALSEALGMPLVTTDARLARASGHGAEIELY